MSRNPTTLEVVGVLVVLAACLVLALAWNEFIYDDWSCAFAECRLNKGD